MTRIKNWVSAFILTASFPVISSNIDSVKVSDNLHILSGKEYGTNIGVIALEEGVVLIDPMPGSEHLAELGKEILSIYGNNARFILNTHSHSDHTGGNEYFIQQGGKVVDGEFNLSGIARIKVTSHSSNDYVYYHEKSNTIFVGDVFDTSWHPTFYAGGTEGFNRAINTILDVGNAQSLIVPGHGVAATKTELKEFRKNTFQWVEIIRQGHESGLGVENMMKDKQVIDALEMFNVSKRTPFVPEKAFKRFIERTVTVIQQESR